MIHELYMIRGNRDERAKELRKAGKEFRLSSMRNQRMHPQYIEDWEQETGKKIKAADKDLGNTFFARVYAIDEV